MKRPPKIRKICVRKTTSAAQSRLSGFSECMSILIGVGLFHSRYLGTDVGLFGARVNRLQNSRVLLWTKMGAIDHLSN